ncbi:MAG: hypothetical protein ACOCRK_08795 [bacterium]
MEDIKNYKNIKIKFQQDEGVLTVNTQTIQDNIKVSYSNYFDTLHIEIDRAVLPNGILDRLNSFEVTFPIGVKYQIPSDDCLIDVEGIMLIIPKFTREDLNKLKEGSLSKYDYYLVKEG